MMLVNKNLCQKKLEVKFQLKCLLQEQKSVYKSNFTSSCNIPPVTLNFLVKLNFKYEID